MIGSGIIKFKKDELIDDGPLYNIYMVIGDGWYVLNKESMRATRFSFLRNYSYMDVLSYAENIC